MGAISGICRHRLDINCPVSQLSIRFLSFVRAGCACCLLSAGSNFHQSLLASYQTFWSPKVHYWLFCCRCFVAGHLCQSVDRAAARRLGDRAKYSSVCCQCHRDLPVNRQGMQCWRIVVANVCCARCKQIAYRAATVRSHLRSGHSNGVTGRRHSFATMLFDPKKNRRGNLLQGTKEICSKGSSPLHQLGSVARTKLARDC